MEANKKQRRSEWTDKLLLYILGFISSQEYLFSLAEGDYVSTNLTFYVD